MTTWREVHDYERSLHDYADRLEATDHPWAKRARQQADSFSRTVLKWAAEAKIAATVARVERDAEEKITRATDVAESAFNRIWDKIAKIGRSQDDAIVSTWDDVIALKKSQQQAIAKSLAVKRTVPVKDEHGRVIRVDVFEGERLVARRIPTYERDRHGLTSKILEVREEVVS